MGLHYRKLLKCGITCTPTEQEKSPCLCAPPLYPPYDDELPQTPYTHAKTKTPTYLIIIFSFVATAFIVLCCYAIYVKFFRSRRTSTTTSSQPQPQQEEEQDLFDEEQQHVDHPIWYIRTTGLQQSLISAITVCKYKKDEGLIEGTECAVCLSEFQEDESLRLLPKCNHAFHLPCIDTWLSSHTNCPMCRAPIVTDPTRVPSMDPSAFASTSFVEEIEVSESTENSADLLRNEEQEGVEEAQVLETSEVVTMQPRRSVSLDSSSAAKINLALATVTSGESHGNNSKRVAKGGCGSSSTSSMKRSRSFNAKHLVSWYGRSQRKTNPNANAPLRSF